MNIEDLTIDCPECAGKGYHIFTQGYEELFTDMYGYHPYVKDGQLVKGCRFCKFGKIPSEEGKQLLEFLRLHINWR
jgi:hypothetical protein